MSAALLLNARAAASVATWDAFLADVPMSWVRA